MTEQLDRVLEITKALADESRVRALMALRGRELCVCQIIELLQLAGSTISKHMSILKQAGLVAARKEGRWIYFRLAEDSEQAEVVEAIAYLRQQLRNDERIRADRRRLREILQLDKEVLCSAQRAG